MMLKIDKLDFSYILLILLKTYKYIERILSNY